MSMFSHNAIARLGIKQTDILQSSEAQQTLDNISIEQKRLDAMINELSGKLTEHGQPLGRNVSAGTG